VANCRATNWRRNDGLMFTPYLNGFRDIKCLYPQPLHQMEKFLTLPQGQFQLRRFPVRKDELLQAWDAADEYLLKYLAAENLSAANSTVLILNDSFGALAVALHQQAPLAQSDSYLSQQATVNNLDLNGISRQAVQLLDSLTLPNQPIDVLLIKLPKTLGLLEDQLHRLRPWLKPDCKVIAAGMVKHMPSTVWTLLERLIGPTTTSPAEKKARLIFATVDPTMVLPKNPYPISYRLENSEFDLCNHANVFSRDSLDIGARFLLQHLPDNPAYRDIIDLGCGNGVIGLVLADRHSTANICFVDESFMALASARHNFLTAFADTRRASFVIDDGLSSFAGNSADCILCNPPFHQQHAVGDHIARQMFQQSHHVLRQGGELRVIGNRHLQYHLSLKKQFGNVQQLAGNAKFVILMAVKR